MYPHLVYGNSRKKCPQCTKGFKEGDTVVAIKCGSTIVLAHPYCTYAVAKLARKLSEERKSKTGEVKMNAV